MDAKQVTLSDDHDTWFWQMLGIMQGEGAGDDYVDVRAWFKDAGMPEALIPLVMHRIAAPVDAIAETVAPIAAGTEFHHRSSDFKRLLVWLEVAKSAP